MNNLEEPELVPNSSAFAFTAVIPRLALKELKLLKVSTRTCPKPSSGNKHAPSRQVP